MSPIIPHFESTAVARPVRGRIEAATIVPTALAGLGQQAQRVAGLLAEFQVVKNQAQNAIEASDKSLAFELEVEDGLRALEQAPDPRTHAQRARELFEDAGNRLLGDATNADVKLRLKPKLNASTEKFFRTARSFENKLIDEQGRVSLFNQLELRERNAVEALDPRDAESEITAGVEEIKTAQGVGLLRPEQAFEREKVFRKSVRIGRAEQELHINPAGFLERIASPEFEDLSPDERLVLQKRAEARVVFLDERRRVQAAEEERLEKRGQRALSQDFIRRTIKGEDVTGSLLDQAGALGDEFDNTFNAVRGVNAARARGDLVASNPSVVQEFDRRLRGVGNPLTRAEVVAAADAGALNGSDTTRLLTGIEQREKEDTGPASRNASLTDAEQFIRRGLQIKVPGVDRMTGLDNERQNTAINLATIEFYDLEAQARRGNQPFDARRVGQALVEKWRNFLVPEGVQEGAIYGAKTFEDAELEIARRVRAGRLEADQARFLLRVAEQMLPKKPKPVQAQQPAEFTAPLTP